MSTIKEQKQIIRETCRKYTSLPLVALSKVQAQSRDRPAKGGVWVSRSKFPAPPEDDLKKALFEVIQQLGKPENILETPDQMAQVEVGAEFVGIRNGMKGDESEPNIEEHEKLRHAEEETDGNIILFMHGGGL